MQLLGHSLNIQAVEEIFTQKQAKIGVGWPHIAVQEVLVRSNTLV
jgi:hypothetical protein